MPAPVLRAITLIGAISSVAFTIYTGRHNASHLLILIFVVWVLSPFAALLWTRRWPAIMLAIPLCSIAIYAYIALGPPRPQIAFTFLIVPAASWLAIAIAAFLTRRDSA